MKAFVQLTTRISPEYYALLRKITFASGRSVVGYIRDAVIAAIERDRLAMQIAATPIGPAAPTVPADGPNETAAGYIYGSTNPAAYANRES